MWPRKKLKRDFRFFEQWARKHNMLPVMRVKEKHGDILIADSGHAFLGSNDAGELGRWYRTAFAIDRGDTTWIASFNDYNAVEFDLVSKNEGQNTRVNECLATARDTLQKLAHTGLFDGRRQGFSKRPH